MMDSISASVMILAMVAGLVFCIIASVIAGKKSRHLDRMEIKINVLKCLGQDETVAILNETYGHAIWLRHEKCDRQGPY